MTTIRKEKYGVIIETDTQTYNFPLNTIILDADDNSGSLNIKLKSYRRTILSIHYSEFKDIKASSAQELAKIIQQTIIYY